MLAGDQGFEPRLTLSESAVLPLNESPKFNKTTLVDTARGARGDHAPCSYPYKSVFARDN